MKKELELYLHIPFCVKKCAYCDFLSAPADRATQKEYVDALTKEIEQYREVYHEEYEVTTIFIGGGTPSLLEEVWINKIFQALHQSFQIAKVAEITIEANPGTVTAGRIKAWKDAGINRLSIGLQSVHREELTMLGRIHTYQEFLETYRLSREHGFENINIDLISAIPGQTVESWENTLTTIASLNPEHISAYSLIIEEGTPFYDNYAKTEKPLKDKSTSIIYRKPEPLPPLPDEETERAIYKTTKELLSQYGYERYEISNYAKKGYACRHNQGYWKRKNYLGIGLGASSLIGHKRYHNTADYKTYIKSIREKADIREEIEELTLAEEMEEYMFLGLRETEGVSIGRFQRNFKKSIFEIYGNQLEKLVKSGLLEIKEDRIFLTNYGIDVSNTVFLEFLEPDV